MNPKDQLFKNISEEFTNLISKFPSKEERETSLIAASKPGLLKKPATFVPRISYEDFEKGNYVKNKKQIDFKGVVENPGFMKIIRDYGELNFGQEGIQKEGETTEDYAARFFREMRAIRNKTSLTLVPELVAMSNASDEDFEKIKKAHHLFEMVDEQRGAIPFLESLYYTFQEPTNYTPLVAAKFGQYIVTKDVGREALTIAIRKKLDKYATRAGVGAGFVTGASQAGGNNQLDYRLGLRDDVNFLPKPVETEGKSISDIVLEYGLNVVDSPLGEGILNAAFGYIEGKTVGVEYRKRYTESRKEIHDELKAIRARLNAKSTIKEQAVGARSTADQALIEQFDNQHEDTFQNFDIFEGRTILDDLSPQTELTNSVIKNDINGRAIDVVKYILLATRDSPDNLSEQTVFLKDISQQVAENKMRVSDAIAEVFKKIDAEEIDDTTLEQALNRAGLTPSQFAKATRTSVKDAAVLFQRLGAFKKTFKKITALDPEAEALITKMLQKQNAVETNTNAFFNFVGSFLRNSKVIAVSAIDTMMRNVYGTGIGLTMESATQVFESSFYAIGRAVRSKESKKIANEHDVKPIRAIIKDSFSTYFYLLGNDVRTLDISERILKYNPNLKNQLFNTLEREVGNQKVSSIAKFFNSFNMAQDAMFRRSVFMSSVDYHLRRVGLDTMDFVATNKPIPPDVLKKAVDDATIATFSYTPKSNKDPNMFQLPLLGKEFINLFERPTGDLFVMFPRFMVNSLDFIAKYNPLISGSGAVMNDIRAAKVAFKDKNFEKANILMDRSRKQYARVVTGSAALLAAYNYRTENPDLKPYEMRKGGKEGLRSQPVDMRLVFPIGPFLMEAELIRLAREGKLNEVMIKETLETLSGMKLPSGTQNSIIANAQKTIDTIQEGGWETLAGQDLKVYLGSLVGDIANRYLQGVKTPMAVFDLFDKEGGFARDPKGAETFSDAILNKIEMKIPPGVPIVEDVVGDRSDLPYAVSRTREEAIVRPGGVFDIVTGTPGQPSLNALEKELNELKLNIYTMFNPTKDKDYDRMVLKRASKKLNKVTIPFLKSDMYVNASREDKKAFLTQSIRNRYTEARKEVKAALSETDRRKFSKLEFMALSPAKRRMINNAYAEKHPEGKTIEQTREFEKYPLFEDVINILKEVP